MVDLEIRDVYFGKILHLH